MTLTNFLNFPLFETMSLSLDQPRALEAPTDLDGAPAWFNELRSEAWTNYQSLEKPSRRDENWRFGSLKKSAIDDFAPAAEFDSSLAPDVTQLEQTSANFIFSNGHCTASSTENLPDGVVCMPLADALEQHGDLVQAHFMKSEVKLGSRRAAALHASQMTNGVIVIVPDGVIVEKPINILQQVSGERTAIFPHTLIVAGANANVKVVETFVSADRNETLIVAMNDLVASEGSRLDYIAIQNVNRASKVVQINDTEVGRDARAKSFVLNLGASWVRNEAMSRLIGEGAHSDMLSVNVPFGEQEYDQRTFQHHVSRGAYSDLLYKNSLYDKSKTVFSGLIFVDEGAHDTDAYQTCRNLFMSDEAEANSMPGLEINADQVKCSHGSTSSQVSEEEIFYLQARGIDARSAKQLIARGFSIEAVERLEDDAIENLLLHFIDAKFLEEEVI